MSLSKKTTTSILWNFAEQLARRGVGLLVTLLLAYFLLPEDFGLVAMMALFLALGVYLADSGFKQALIRTQAIEQIDLSTAFYANIMLGVIAYILLFAAAPTIADFYNEPRLVALLRVASIQVVISAFQVVHGAVLSRELNFRLQFKTALPASIVSGLVAVVMAWQGAGVWSLVIQILVYTTVNTLLLWYFQPWRPSLQFSRCSLLQMYRFGYKIFLTGVIDTLFKNMYMVVIAKIFPIATAGLYFFADRIRELIINQLITSVQSVIFPAFATIQDDSERLKAAYRKLTSVMAFLLFPAILFIAVLAEPLFTVFLPEKWSPAMPYLQLMCLATLMTPLHVININILKVKGRSDLLLGLEILKKSILVIALAISVQYGVIGILLGQIIISVIAFIPNSFYSEKLVGYSVAQQLRDFLPAMILAGVVAAVIHYSVNYFDMSAILELLIFGLLGTVIYIACSYILRFPALFVCLRIITNGKQDEITNEIA